MYCLHPQGLGISQTGKQVVSRGVFYLLPAYLGYSLTLHMQAVSFPLNVSKLLPDYVASCLRRWYIYFILLVCKCVSLYKTIILDASLRAGIVEII
jgi:hypothetical protein